MKCCTVQQEKKPLHVSHFSAHQHATYVYCTSTGVRSMQINMLHAIQKDVFSTLFPPTYRRKMHSRGTGCAISAQKASFSSKSTDKCVATVGDRRLQGRFCALLSDSVPSTNHKFSSPMLQRPHSQCGDTGKQGLFTEQLIPCLSMSPSF